jgi:hypothetical protein
MSDSKIDLSRVTAVCVDGRLIDDLTLERYQKILNFMISKINFGSVKFIGTRDPEINGVDFHKTSRLGILDYSKFCLFRLTEYVNTDFCLIFQDDGFIVNPHLWEDSFYNYDYIGSPWPLYMGWPIEGQQVGNGGFSLRSKDLLNFTRTFTEHTTENEDTYIVSDRRESLVNFGLKIAPIEIARLFSVENPIDDKHNINTCFGFHSKNKMEDATKKITHYE